MRHINIYINLVYLTYFLLLRGVFDPIHKNIFLILLFAGLFIKASFLKFYFDSNVYKIVLLIKPLEIIIFLISILFLLKNLKFLLNNFGILTISIYSLLFLVGYFIGISKKQKD
jgi:hypothetical protein